MSDPIYLSADIRRIEKAAGDASPPLMERAGAAAAAAAASLASDKKKDVLVLAGPGDNGGDARVLAGRLKEQFFRVSVAARLEEIPAEKNWGLVVDGLFGIGLGREIGGDFAKLVRYVNEQACPVLALDVPSGIEADTGRVLGCAVRATHTVTFIALKPGLLTLDGPDHCGHVSVADLGLEVKKLLAPSGWVASPETFRHADDVLGQDLDALVVGPGIGTGERAETLVGAALASDIPCVLDADALNVISGNPDLRKACSRRSADTLLTPHPAEAARLLGEGIADIQANRIQAARNLARHFNAHVVLKGNGSVMVARDRHWFVNTSGNPGMASAGMGDVLAGLLGALLAQRFSGESSLVLGVHLHGCAADELARSGIGPVGLAAGELLDPARRIWNSWLA